MRLLSVMAIMTLLQGCAAAALTAAGIAGGVGVEHTLSGISYKTFNEPMNRVRLATLRALDGMAMPVRKDMKSEDGKGWIIEARANEREIEIELEKLSSRTTHMRVVANKGEIFFKDAATSTEIIVQTAHRLERRGTRTTANR